MVWENTAAAVLEFGALEQSPNDQILLYLVCLIVCLSISTKPASLAIPDSLRNGAGLIGGTICKKPNGFYILSFVYKCSKVAISLVTSTKLCLKVTSIKWLLATSVNVWLYLGTPNITAPALMYSTSIGRFCFRH